MVSRLVEFNVPGKHVLVSTELLALSGATWSHG